MLDCCKYCVRSCREKELKEAAKATKAAAKASKGKGKDKDTEGEKAEDDKHEDASKPAGPSSNKDPKDVKELSAFETGRMSGAGTGMGPGTSGGASAGAGTATGPTVKRASEGQLISIDSGPVLIELAPSPIKSLTQPKPPMLGSIKISGGASANASAGGGALIDLLAPSPQHQHAQQAALPPPSFATSAADAVPSTPGTIMVRREGVGRTAGSSTQDNMHCNIHMHSSPANTHLFYPCSVLGTIDSRHHA